MLLSLMLLQSSVCGSYWILRRLAMSNSLGSSVRYPSSLAPGSLLPDHYAGRFCGSVMHVPSESHLMYARVILVAAVLKLVQCSVCVARASTVAVLFCVFCMQCFVCYGGLWGQEFGTLPNVSPSLLLRWDLPGHGHPGCRIYMNAEWIFLCNLVRIIL